MHQDTTMQDSNEHYERSVAPNHVHDWHSSKAELRHCAKTSFKFCDQSIALYCCIHVTLNTLQLHTRHAPMNAQVSGVLLTLYSTESLAHAVLKMIGCILWSYRTAHPYDNLQLWQHMRSDPLTPPSFLLLMQNWQRTDRCFDTSRERSQLGLAFNHFVKDIRQLSQNKTAHADSTLIGFR